MTSRENWFILLLPAQKKTADIGVGRIKLMEEKIMQNEYNTAVVTDTSADKITIEIPIDNYTDKQISNVINIVKGKSTLIKKSLGVKKVPVERTETTLKFPWFKLETDAEKIDVYAAFIAGLCKKAKNQIRASAIEKRVQNEKYAFRIFLLKLGFIGDEYKAIRKILLANLKGDSSFRDKMHRRSSAKRASK